MKEQNQQVPDLKLDEHQKISVQTKEIPLLVNGQEAKVVIKKLSTGVRNRIRSECSQIKIIGNQQSVTVNDAEIQEKILFACIVEAPFEKTLNNIRELPAEVSDYLFEEYNKFAEPTLKKKD